MRCLKEGCFRQEQHGGMSSQGTLINMAGRGLREKKERTGDVIRLQCSWLCMSNATETLASLAMSGYRHTGLYKAFMFSKYSPLADRSKILHQTSACTLSLKMVHCRQSASMWGGRQAQSERHSTLFIINVSGEGVGQRWMASRV